MPTLTNAPPVYTMAGLGALSRSNGHKGMTKGIQKMATFKVTGKGSIMTRGGAIRTPGMSFESDEVGETIHELLRDGKAVQIAGRTVEALKTTPESALPNITEMRVGSDGDLKPVGVTQTTTVKPAAPNGQTTGVWTLSPESIKDKSLAELNAMIVERDSTVPAFDDKTEAIAFLSQDVK